MTTFAEYETMCLDAARVELAADVARFDPKLASELLNQGPITSGPENAIVVGSTVRRAEKLLLGVAEGDGTEAEEAKAALLRIDLLMSEVWASLGFLAKTALEAELERKTA